MASPTFPIRLDSTETQVNVPNPVIPRSPVQPGFSIRFNQNLIDQMSAPFPYTISLQQILQSGATINQVPVWNGSQWVPLTLAGGSGILSLNGLTTPVQTFQTGTSGTDFSISSAGSVHTFDIPNASAVNRGLLTPTDWSTFNGKFDQPTGTILQYIRGDGSLATFPTVLPTTWGSITGVLSNQTDLQSALNGKFNNPTGTTLQYIRGDGTLATLPTSLPPSGSAGGDLSGTYPNPTVVWGNGFTTYDARYFRQGGNAFGATAVLGTTNAQALSVITNNATRMQIDTSGYAAIGGNIASGRRLIVWGEGTSSASFSASFNNLSNSILSIRNDGEVILGSTGFGPRMRVLNAAGNADPANGQVLGFRKAATTGQAFPDFNFDSVAVTSIDSDGQGCIRLNPSWSNAFNRPYYILNISGTISTVGTNAVQGLLINPTVTNGDFRAIEATSGRFIFNGAQSVARRNITGNRTLDGTDYIINVSAAGGNITITLPTLTEAVSRVYIIKRTDTSSNTVTIVGTIDGVANYSLFGSLSVCLEWDNAGSTWRTF